MSKLFVTHTQPHQADEVAALVALRIIHPDAKIVRTRDTQVLSAMALAPDTFLLDVGGHYDADKLMFDHHQPEGAGFRRPETGEWPYATAGLIWKHYGAQVVETLHPELTPADCQEVAAYIDEYLMKFLDAVDCGVRIKSAGPSLSAIIASFNSSWYDDTEADPFPLILDLAQVVLTNFIRRYAGKILARERVRNSRISKCGRILHLDICLPWSDVVSREMPEILLVTYPVSNKKDGASQWQIRTTVNANMTPRIRLPQAWGGHDGQALVRATGLRDAIFCHRSRHLAGASSFDAVLTLADIAIQNHEESLAPVLLAA